MGERSSVNVAPSLSPHGRRAPAARRTPFPPSPERRALDRARRRLLELQRPDGCWCGELQGDTILESEYVLLMAFLGRENDDKARKAAEYVRRQQRADGSWGCYPGGPIELSGSVKAYFALKLTGHDPGAPYMAKAREAIRARAAPAAATASPNSISRFSDNFPTPTVRRCRRSWCCCRAGSTSTSTPCRAGRAPSSCRSASSRRPSRCAVCRRNSASASCSSSRPRRRCRRGRRRAACSAGATSSSASMPSTRRRNGSACSVHSARSPWRRRPRGCASASGTATASAPFSRR